MSPHADVPKTDSVDSARSGVLEALSARLRTPLRRFFEKRNIPRDEIEDLTQEVFLRLAGRAGVESMKRVEAYLFATAANLLRDRHRRLMARAAERHEPYEEGIHGSSQETVGPDRALLGAQRVEQLIAGLRELPERTRVIFTLYHLEDMPHQQIAQRLGIAVSTIEKQMARAHAHLIKKLEGL